MMVVVREMMIVMVLMREGIGDGDDGNDGDDVMALVIGMVEGDPMWWW